MAVWKGLGVCSQMRPAVNPNLASILRTADHPSVYAPSDDSFLLADALADHITGGNIRPRLCVEIGCGSGYIICSIARLLAHADVKTHCIAVDINPHAVDCTARTLGNHQVEDIDLVICNLLDPMLQHLHKKVDLLVFNPPYVPTTEEEATRSGIAQAWAGGCRGRSVTNRILPNVQVRALLSEQGCCFIVAVAENDPQGIIQEMSTQGLQGDIFAKRQADEEALCIIRLGVKQREVLQFKSS